METNQTIVLVIISSPIIFMIGMSLIATLKFFRFLMKNPQEQENELRRYTHV